MAPFAAPQPGELPPADHPDRWLFLQRLRRHTPLDPAPWWQALGAGAIELRLDLVTVLLELDPEAGAGPLLEAWLRCPEPDPGLAALIGQRRQPALAARFRQLLRQDLPPERAAVLLAALGHQRDPQDFPLLQRLVVQPGPRQQRRAALEALLVGLAAWPLQPLRRTLQVLVADLDPGLASEAVDALARLPQARAWLQPLRHQALDPSVAQRLERRLVSLPPSPLLLLVHGRAGGVRPPELEQLRLELEQRRGVPVLLQALTDPQPPSWPPAPERQSWALAAPALTLVPLFLLPGGHVRRDIPALAASWRQRCGAVRRLPFLGAWPAWQQALAQELARLAGEGAAPVLLHHPLEGALAPRYLAHLARATATPVHAAAYTAPAASLTPLPSSALPVPLALASCRLTEALGAPPLLLRPSLHRQLLAWLEALP